MDNLDSTSFLAETVSITSPINTEMHAPACACRWNYQFPARPFFRAGADFGYELWPCVIESKLSPKYPVRSKDAAIV